MVHATVCNCNDVVYMVTVRTAFVDAFDQLKIGIRRDCIAFSGTISVDVCFHSSFPLGLLDRQSCRSHYITSANCLALEADVEICIPYYWPLRAEAAKLED